MKFVYVIGIVNPYQFYVNFVLVEFSPTLITEYLLGHKSSY